MNEDSWIVFDNENINSLIKYWRAKKAKAVSKEYRLTCACYIDAYQTVRVNHGLKLLPEDNEND